MRLKKDDKGRSTKETTSDSAYGERYAAGRGFDPSFSADVRVGTILMSICAGVIQYRRTSTFVGIRIFCVHVSVDRKPRF